MKKSILFLLALLPLFVLGQNENSTLGIYYLGNQNGNAVIKLTNNTGNLTPIKVTFQGSTSVYQVNANSSDTLYLVLIGNDILIKATSVPYNSTVQLTVNPSSLPVKFTGIHAYTANNAVIIKWSTEERNVNHFSVQKSYDGATWITTGTVQAGYTSYSFTDSNPSSYYRIQSIDNDGAIDYSNVVKISLSTSLMNVYPNPVKSSTIITVDKADKIIVYNNAGAILKQLDSRGRNSIQLDMAGYSSGMYYVSNGLNTIQLVKE